MKMNQQKKQNMEKYVIEAMDRLGTHPLNPVNAVYPNINERLANQTVTEEYRPPKFDDSVGVLREVLQSSTVQAGYVTPRFFNFGTPAKSDVPLFLFKRSTVSTQYQQDISQRRFIGFDDRNFRSNEEYRSLADESKQLPARSIKFTTPENNAINVNPVRAQDDRRGEL